ncbi:MAG: FecR domain-containing protein [Chitinophagaceae bacterium]|nr:FecR domain-containing protein [Chitinophagaceae bacterium]
MPLDIKQLADRYLKNLCTQEEAKLVLDWFHTTPGMDYLNAQLGKDIQLLENNKLFISPVNVPSAGMLDHILNNITDKPVAAPAKIIEPSLKAVPQAVSGLKTWYKIAVAIIGIAAGLSVTYMWLADRRIIRSTQYGEIARIILPDSSSVTLNGNSSISYAADWNNTGTREVELKGEALFSVKHTYNNQKFIVKTADTILIEVLGTEFNVSGRKRQTQVVLVSGKISLSIPGKHFKNAPLIMAPGESVAITADGERPYMHVVDPSAITSWTDNKLVFENTRVREIFEHLKDVYGYQISTSDSKIMDQRITGSVSSKSLDMVLEGLEAILDVNFTKRPTR